jgi:Fe2+ or Zn2+ uptake regulation protein
MVSVIMAQLTMPSSDFFVLKVLERANGRRVTYEDIASACEIGFSTRTVCRALTRLENQSHIKKLNRSRQGCIYQILKKDH